MLRATLAAVLLACAVFAGCVLFTGGTNGYTAPEGGSSTGCTTSKQCGDAQSCCYVLDGATPSTACQASCDKSYEKACTVGSDCGDGGSCLSQSCTLEAGPEIPISVTVTVTTCGPIPVCSQ